MFFPRRPDESASDFLAPVCGMSAKAMKDVLRSADHLDLVELVM
jgi:hypothetical protein